MDDSAPPGPPAHPGRRPDEPGLPEQDAGDGQADPSGRSGSSGFPPGPGRGAGRTALSTGNPRGDRGHRTPGARLRAAAGRSLGAAGVAAAVFGAGFACTGGSAPSLAGPNPEPSVVVTGQQPEPPQAVGALAADQVPPSSNPCATRRRPAGWDAAENARPGDPGWRRAADADGDLHGYLGEVSAACGDSVDLHLSGYDGHASVTAYRIGWYGGTGGRQVWTAHDVPVSAGSTHNSGAPTYTVEAEWPVALRIPITSAWTPGYYLVVARAQPGDNGDAMPLVIRDDSDGNGKPGTGSSPLLFQASVLTYQAYNMYGHYSLYNGPRDRSAQRSDRSRVVSFDRPYEGSGYSAPFVYDVPMVEAIERLGLDADYTTDIDVDRRPSQVPAHRALIIGGHSEYWTRRMYDAALYARDHGTNIAFFGANEVYWHARLESSPSGPDRRMAVYRVAKEDPLAAQDPSQATVQWAADPLDRPEASLVGAAYGELGADGGAFRVLQPASWVFSGLQVNGLTLPASLGGEYDTVKPDSGATPPDISVLAAAPIVFGGQPTMATMSYYTDPSGAGVFSGGMTYWPCEAEASCPGRTTDPRTAKVLATVTANVLEVFAAGPAGRGHPSARELPPTADALVSTAAAPGDVGIGPPH